MLKAIYTNLTEDRTTISDVFKEICVIMSYVRSDYNGFGNNSYLYRS